MKLLRFILYSLASIVAGLCTAWAVGALHFDFPKGGAFAAILFVTALLAMRSPSTTCGAVTTAHRRISRRTGKRARSPMKCCQDHAVATGGLSFTELKQRSLINERARAADQNPEFSSIIREGLPRSD
jgi:hypothetical protein